MATEAPLGCVRCGTGPGGGYLAELGFDFLPVSLHHVPVCRLFAKRRVVGDGCLVGQMVLLGLVLESASVGSWVGLAEDPGRRDHLARTLLLVAFAQVHVLFELVVVSD